MARSLYICYFGVREPLVQTQVIPYLRELVKDGHRISLLTFDRSKQGSSEIIEKLAASGIKWYSLRYHKRLSVLATAYDIFRGANFLRSLIREERLDILHGRSHVPTLMGLLARRFSGQRPALLFDIRGFMPEEYTDAGLWQENGWLYSAVKCIEAWLIKGADGFVVLTEKARDILFPESRGTGLDSYDRPVEVIPCCVDLEQRFTFSNVEKRQRTRRELGITDRFAIIHVGALGGLYLQKEMADFLAVFRNQDPTVFCIFLTQTSPQLIIPELKKRGFSESDYIVQRVPASEVPRFLEASDLGLSFVKATFSTLSRSPTKIPEYLVCGLPIVANRGVGDVDELIEDNRVGVVVDDFSDKSYRSAIASIKLLGNAADHCRSVAVRHFDLETVGGAKYRELYAKLSKRES